MSNARTLAGFKPSTLGTLATKSTVLTSDITDLTIATADIADNAVTTAKIPDSAVTAAKIPDAALTPAKLSQKFTAGTSVASTSGTSIDFTGIPSWAKRITVALSGVSLSGTSSILVQLGTSGGVANSGYTGAVVSTTGGTIQALSAGFQAAVTPGTATSLWHGTATILNITGNQWTETGQVADGVNLTGQRNNGSVTLAGVLDRVRITTVNGTDTFDAGTINIFYE